MSVESAAQVQSFKEWLKTSFSVDLEVPLLAPCKSRALSLSLGLSLSVCSFQDLGVALRCDQFGGIGVFVPWRRGDCLAAALLWEL